MKPQVCVSLMCMDFLHVKRQLDIFNRHFDGLHFDVMDGHFCRNIALSPDFLKAIRPASSLPIDVHLMMTEPADYIETFASAGATSISLHAETINASAFRNLDLIRSLGCKTGLVLNPATTLESVQYLLGRVDILTIMTVDVGFAGQKFIGEMLQKIKRAKELRKANDWQYQIQIDGGCKKENYRQLYEAGAEIFIVGNAGLFSLSDDLEKASVIAHRQLQEAICGI